MRSVYAILENRAGKEVVTIEVVAFVLDRLSLLLLAGKWSDIPMRCYALVGVYVLGSL